MKYSTRAFKELLLQIIQRFESNYRDTVLQQKAALYKKDLRQAIARTATSTLLWTEVYRMVKKMPYFFSKIGYLTADLAEFLKDNTYRDCMETDDYEKAELEAFQQTPLTPNGLATAELNVQLKKEQAKVKSYSDLMTQVITEKNTLAVKLKDEMEKVRNYQKKLQDLFGKCSNSAQSSGFIEDKQLITELQQFNEALLNENEQLANANQQLHKKYEDMLALNKKLKERCDQLEQNYKSLSKKMDEQNGAFDSKILQIQEQLKLEMDKRFKEREQPPTSGSLHALPPASHLNSLNSSKFNLT